ncbi:MAG: hypothetical protein ACK5YV_00075 [Betaproteobacteria bacterium]
MELWLALFGLVAAVLMIWSARKRHRDTSGGAAAGPGAGPAAGGAAHQRNGDGHDGDGGGGD